VSDRLHRLNLTAKPCYAIVQYLAIGVIARSLWLLDDDRPLALRIPGAKSDAHTTFGELGEDVVATCDDAILHVT
jgi:hypothetical protein